MRIGAAFPSKYIKAADLPEGRVVKATIARVDVENVAGNDNPDEEKPVLYFEGKSKGMVLNKTNANIISAAYGDETDEWAGRQVGLYATETLFQGKMVPTIRVKVDAGMKAAQPVAANGAKKRPAARIEPTEGEDIADADAEDKLQDIPF